MTPDRLRIAVLCPHFTPDTAPTGAVMTRIVTELAALGHELHVVTALPWYRSHAVEPGWETCWFRREKTEWGSITRVNPFAGDDKRNLLRRAAGFVGFSALAGLASLRGGRVERFVRRGAPASSVPGGVPVTSSYSSIGPARARAKPILSCLTWASRSGGTRRGRFGRS